MPTSLLNKLFANLPFQTLIHPQDPTANLVAPNPELDQSGSQILREHTCGPKLA
jgi:hypothetical protein